MATIATHSSTTAISPVIPVRSIGHVMRRWTIDFAIASILPAQGERRESARGFCGVTAPLSPRFGIRLVTHNVADRKLGYPCAKKGSGRGIGASDARGAELAVLGVYSSELEQIGGLLAEEGPEGRAPIAGPGDHPDMAVDSCADDRDACELAVTCGCGPRHNGMEPGSSRPLWSVVQRIADRVRVDALRE
jgi:hypothetical protein